MENHEIVMESKKLLHDLNNKLSIISCYGSFIRMDMDHIDDVTRNLRIISETAIQSGNIVFQIQKNMAELLKQLEKKD